MRGCFWNSDGFGNRGKHLFVQETIKQYKLDFIAILKIGRSSFSAPFLTSLAEGGDFEWHCLPPQGRSGSILVGINMATLKVKNVFNGDWCITFHLVSKLDGFEWAMIPVYGAAQDE